MIPLTQFTNHRSTPLAWSKAVTTFIPKEEDSHNINQFRGIALLNVEGKIFFSVMAKRMTSYLLANTVMAESLETPGKTEINHLL